MTPTSRGVLLAAASAVAFGATTPFLERAARGASPFAVAFALYGGAALAAFGMRAASTTKDAPLRREHAPRVLLVGLLGAALAPAALAWGLVRTGAAAGALLLSLEGAFTALLAWALYREPVGRRVAIAIALTGMGAVAVAMPSGPISGVDAAGAGAIALATLAWAADNTVMRPLADVDPVAVVAAKATTGASLSLAITLAIRGRFPPVAHVAVIAVCGAVGYAASLRLYLLAQRRVGAARTASVFALAPFVGAALAFALGDRGRPAAIGVASALFAVGAWLHATERHAHWHRHEPLVHEHMHRHDDAHHDHSHVPPVSGEHSHAHEHAAREHTHDHAPDLHHGHGHDGGGAHTRG